MIRRRELAITTRRTIVYSLVSATPLLSSFHLFARVINYSPTNTLDLQNP